MTKWIVACQQGNWKPSNYSLLCSSHFKKDDYQIRPGASKPYLKEDAVPTIFNFPNRRKPPHTLAGNINEKNMTTFVRVSIIHFIIW